MTTNETSESLDLAGRIQGKAREAQELVTLGGSSDRLTDEQVAIVSAPLDPTLVVAGAGSGKTETLSLRFVYLLDHARGLFGRDLSPDEILCLTFTRKAAGEIAERVAGHIERVFGPDVDRPLPAVSTYNAYAAGLVAEHGLRVGVDPESTVLTDASLWQMAARVAETWEGSLDFDGGLAAAASAVPALASSLADHGVTTDEFVGYLERVVGTIGALPLGPRSRSENKRDDLAAPFRSRASLAALVERFQATKREASVLDFSDQIAIAVGLARLPVVQALERARYRAVLLDEFQDTSPGQLDLFADLFGAGHPIMAVGDPLQAIYGFRGASEAALERFIERFAVKGGARMTLSVSWRNSSEVLRAANAATESLRSSSRIEVPILRSNFEETGVEEPPRMLPAVTAQVFSDPEAEAEGLVSLLAEHRAALEQGRDPKSPVECAILCRVRRHFPMIVNALKEAGLDFQVVGLGGLLDTPVVVDLVALLQVAHDPSRGDSLMRLLTSERVALGVRDLAALGEWAEEVAGPREEREVEASIV
ncbi:MAG: ATP-dependent helicase, partial [Demequinaceae bacterium]|nr:ATP-dependent helicase [Demequinaceae bacterium]